jgi:hypothetical protein
MGANAVTTVPVYTAGEVLTAADMNITNSGIPVFADSTARDNSFGGTGEKVLAEGQYAYLESTNATQVYDGANWVSVGTAPGLVLVKSQVIGTTVGSVEVTGAFSSTYDSYKIVISGGAASVNDELLGLKLGSTTTGYSMSYVGTVYGTNAQTLVSNDSAASFTRIGATYTAAIQANFDLVNPFLAANTFVTGAHVFPGAARNFAGLLANTTSYTAFTLTPASGTLTGGTIRVYGYANS